MKNIFSFLEKFKSLKDPKKEKEDVVKVISEFLGFKIDSEKVFIGSGNISIKENGAIKSEIFLKKDVLIKTLNERFPKMNVRNIL